MEDSMKQVEGEEALTMLVRFYESAEQATEDNRREAETWRDYRNGNQWTEAEAAVLKKRKQPIVTIDRIGPKVDFLLGMEAGQRSDPKAYPRTPKEEQGAEAATDALRFVMDQSRWDEVRSEAFDGFIVEGCCGADVRIVEKYGEPCIEVLPIMWDRMFYDPHSRLRNFSDAKFKGQFVWMDLDDALAKWPDKEDALNSTMAAESAAQGQTFDDVPRLRWADPKRRRVRIVEMWSNEAEGVFHSTFTKAGVLKRMPSPYVDEHGAQEDGFVFGSCYIDRDGNRFGVVKRWISLQDEINKRRSKAMHLMNTRQTFGNALTGDKNHLKAELAKPDGHVELQGDAKLGEDFGVIPTGDMADAQFQLLQEAKQEIDAVGVNAAMSGTEQRVMSGRALMARQEMGQNELGPVFDWFKSWQLAVYRKVWNRVRQYWTAEKWVRVTDDERNVRFVGLNQPQTMGEKIINDMRAQGVKVTPEMEQEAKASPALQQPAEVKNNVAEMDVDITLDTAPATASLQIEQFQGLIELAKGGIPIPPRALIKASSIRNKDEILDEMDGKGEEGAMAIQKLQEAQQVIQQLKQQLQEAQSGMAVKQVEIEGRLQQTAMSEESKARLARMQMESAERIAALNADVKRDMGELAGAIQLMAKKLEVPLSLSTEVEEDIAEPEPVEEKPDPMMLLAEAIAQMNKPKRKRVVAPSGQVYAIEDMQDEQ
jgi:hypothetical protein